MRCKDGIYTVNRTPGNGSLRNKRVATIFRRVTWRRRRITLRNNEPYIHLTPTTTTIIPLTHTYTLKSGDDRRRSRQIAGRLKLFNNPFYFLFVFVKTTAQHPSVPHLALPRDPPGQTTNGPQLLRTTCAVGNVSGLMIFSFLPPPVRPTPNRELLWTMMATAIVCTGTKGWRLLKRRTVPVPNLWRTMVVTLPTTDSHRWMLRGMLLLF